MSALVDHLASGVTTVCRCWALTRRDGVTLGFTDHDREIAFDGITFRADTGMAARALQQTTGLSVDNTEALGALSDPSISEADVEAGRFDGAEVRAWTVNWQNTDERALTFRGHLGEIVRAGGGFRAELRGLSEALNRPVGRAYHARCPAVLGDAKCGVDLSDPQFFVEAPLVAVAEGRRLDIADTGTHPDGWFLRGALTVLDGAAAGHRAVVRADEIRDGIRRLTLWEEVRAPIAVDDTIRVAAGCDKRASTCAAKFANMLNFRGFPTIPGEDWLLSYPRSGDQNDGGSLS